METLKIPTDALKGTANLMYATGCNLYYKIDTDTNTYVFSIDMKDEQSVGTARFEPSMKGIHLQRWIRMAIENDEFTIVNK